MKKNWWKPLIILYITGTLFTCIEPFSPRLDQYQSVLVVDALLTDENESNYVRLSHTIKTANEEPEMVSGALVMVKDDQGKSTTLSETSAGIYITNSSTFRGEIGRSYKLYIKTDDGEEYESDLSLMYPVQDIDSVYFSKEQETVGDETLEGIMIYMDSKGECDCQYYRWTYEEWWKFCAPYPKLYDYVSEDTIIALPTVNDTCWSNNKSDEINIKSIGAGISNKFEKKPILFIATDKSDRLLIQYNIKVRQLSISKEEYEFWDMMSQINESGGDIFDKQPFEISGNIHNINKPDEQVLGYFQVSGAKTESIYISFKEVAELDVPRFQYTCATIALGPVDFPPPPSPAAPPPPTFDEIYTMYIRAGYTFAQPLFNDNGELLRLLFVAPLCADCSLSGSLTKPDFWIDQQ